MSAEYRRAEEGAPRVPLRAIDDISERMRPLVDRDRKVFGRVRNITRAVATSPATWQATVRAEQMFVTMKRVDAATRALLCLYTSLLNGCHYCIDDAAGVALEEGVPTGVIRSLVEPAPALDEGTAARLAYARFVALGEAEAPEGTVAHLARYADTEEILEVTAIVAMKCFWNRFVTALRIPPEGRCADPRLLALLFSAAERLQGEAASHCSGRR
ncbi:carboxymuconolactone decarboxylase family protein [Streptomyces longwoodensis]|uniref:carboxymuconolactone decarboxylase family protein n=1 Tax=Streptomyces longwoodensis TaxID=68231 RepID=UPI003247BD2D